MYLARPAEMLKTPVKPRQHTGFSLVEVAIVLLVLGIALGGLLGAIGQNTENTRRIEAKNKLREIEEALYAFAQVQGRLPCPADSDTVGIEDVTSMTAGTCDKYHGLLPNATLGLSGTVDSNGFLQDPWGNPYRYSVVTNTPGNYKYTGTTSIQNLYTNAATAIAANPPSTLCVSSGIACSGNVLTNVAPAVVLSMGNNWASVATGSVTEQENGSGTTLGTYTVTNDGNFVVTGYSEENFDDMLVWLSPHLLFSKMIQAGWTPP